MVSVLTKIKGVRDKMAKSTPLQINAVWTSRRIGVLSSEDGKTVTNDKNVTGIRDAEQNAKRPHKGPDDAAPKE